MDINSVVQVSITRETKVPSVKGFGVPAILSTEIASLPALVNEYSSDTVLTELVAAGIATSTETYKACLAIVSQNPKPEKIKLIKQSAAVAQVATLTIVTVEAEATYAVTLDGVVYEFTSGVGAVEADIIAGLVALINPLTQVNMVGLVITAAEAGKGFSLAVDAKMSFVATTANNGPVEDLIAARDVDDDWYFLLTTTHTPLQTKLIASYIESEIKLFVYQTSDANSKSIVLASDTTSLLVILKDLNYDRSLGVWTPADKITQYKQAGWVGRQATKEPGSSNWKFKSVKGASADKYTSAELANIQNKNGNVYVTIGGIDMFQEGVVASGEFIDIMIGTDWIQARIKEAVFGLLAKEEKVPYDDGGIEAIVLQVENILNQAVTRTILVSDANLDVDGNGMGPKVTAPTRAQTTTQDRAARVLNDVKFTGNYAGAINKVRIAGTISV